MGKLALNMKNKQFSTAAAMICAIAAIIILFATCLSSQESYDAFKWDRSSYFKSPEYTSQKNKFLNWSEYTMTWDGKQFATWGVLALTGIAQGMREAYHADPYVFETRWGVGSKSFWGSDAWERNYIGNNPSNPHRSEFFGNVGRDVWHTMNAVSVIPMATTVFIIGARKQPLKFRVANMLLGMGARSLFCTITYETLRR